VPLRHGYTGGPARAFRLGAAGLAEFPIARWGDLARRRWDSAGPAALDYGVVAGYAPLRTAIARYLAVSRSVRCEPDQVLIVNGTQQALDLIARVLLNPGEQAWLEDPGYDGARGALVAAGARVVPVPVDHEGLDVAAGVRRAPRAKLAYVTPAHQFPLGSTMSLPRRLDLLRWAHKARAWLIEDDYDGEFRYVNRPLASLQGLDTAGCVIYTGTFSKALFPALRLGYLVVPAALIQTFIKVRFFLDVHTPTFMQTVLADFITEGHFERHLLRTRIRCRERREALRAGLQRDLGGLLEVESSEGGMHVLAWLPEHVSDREAARRAAAEGIDTLPLSAFAQTRLSRGALVLGYAGLTPDDIASGTKRLARALHPLRRQVRGRRRDPRPSSPGPREP
jgi:GntR family transcriptional regulator/MocR family aminotransferase